MNLKYEILEHTADTGLIVFGKNRTALFSNAAFGLYDLMTDRKSIQKLRPEPVEIRLEAENPAELFLKWLKELLFLFSSKKLILLDLNFEALSETHLKCSAQAVRFDPKHDDQKIEIKAVTHHGFEYSEEGRPWRAKVIFDI